MATTTITGNDIELRHWTLAEYYQLVDLDFFRAERVELIHGQVVQMPPMRNDHGIALGLMQEYLGNAFGANHWIRVQMPLNVGMDSAPEPDLAVVTGKPRDYQEHPNTALLVVEISHSSLAYDRKIKSEIYASANIPEYWLVNLVQRRLEVFRQPSNNGYSDTFILEENDAVAPWQNTNAKILVKELLP